ncbi:MAG: sigma-54 dependent transcriptional regulator [Hydrogenobacter sp.]|uniref:sigma-54 interaction domain-containing protein n=1 Tax=Hydrogenobacter thermophilus TaxID=940 RepID=UPI0030F4C670
MKRLLYTRDLSLSVEGFEKVEELPEELAGTLVLVDIDTVGLSCLPDLKEGGNVPVAITSKGIPGYTIKLVSLGFYDVFLKPVDRRRLNKLIADLEGGLRDDDNIIPLAEGEDMSGDLCKELCSIIGNPEGRMKEVLLKIGKASALDVPVLLLGETGVGKEIFAKALWKTSKRWNAPFVAVNCTAIPPELLEAELFGYEKGAFTGAVSSKEGLIESARGGVLFLDEVGDLPLHIQPKLLRVLQEKKLRRLGSTKEIHCDFRLVCATNKDIRKLVKEGFFREDLYYRISTVEIYIPPLRERREDIPILINCILSNISKETGRRIAGYTEGFLRKALNYSWPGNVRELENALKRAMVLCRGDILKEKDLDVESGEYVPQNFEDVLRDEVKKLLRGGEEGLYYKLMGKVSRIIAEEAFNFFEENYSRTARYLGINRITLKRILQGLSNPEKTFSFFQK